MTNIPEEIKRRMVEHDLHAKDETSFELRVNRYLEVAQQSVIPNHYFAKASTECISLYVDGYFLSAVMVTQAVSEGILKLVAERNGISHGKNGDEVINLLLQKKLISQSCADAFNRIYKCFRNDIHHMNPKVGEIDFSTLAKRNIQDLALIEREIFACKFVNGAWAPVNPKYWDIQPNGTAPVFLRCDP